MESGALSTVTAGRGANVFQQGTSFHSIGDDEEMAATKDLKEEYEQQWL